MLLWLPEAYAQSSIDYDTVQARENYWLGVSAYHSGYFNRAVVAFEKALSLKPDFFEAKIWLARSYYSSGYISIALEEWKDLTEKGEASALIRNFHDIVRYRYENMGFFPKPGPYVLSQSLKNPEEAVPSPLFYNISSIVSTSRQKGLFLVDYFGNQVTVLGANGNLLYRMKGSLQYPYRHPFDILFHPGGGFIVSQMDNNQLFFLDASGNVVKIIGSQGKGLGSFLKPQYMADSGNGYFYVSDWGNRFVNKLDYEGNFIFQFGGPQGDFPGLQGPAGIAVRDDIVYVADTIAQSVYQFDQEGLYQGVLLGNSLLSAPEDLLLRGDSALLISDQNRILSYDFSQLEVEELYTGTKDQVYRGIGYDRNQQLVAADMQNRQVDVLVSRDLLYSNLFVRIKQIITENYPSVEVDLEVENRYGQPVVDLETENFSLYEARNFVPSTLQYQRTEDQTVALGVIVTDGNQKTKVLIERLVQLLGEKDVFRLIRAGERPEVVWRERKGWAGLLDDRAGASAGPLADTLRFAVDSLMETRKRKIIVYINEALSEVPFGEGKLINLESYLRLEKVVLYGIGSGENQFFSYLSEQTGGRIYQKLVPEVFADVLEEKRRMLSGHYTLRYHSFSKNDLLNRYLPVDIEVKYLRQNGKDGLGFFVPIY